MEPVSLEASKFQTFLTTHYVVQQKVTQEPWKGRVGNVHVVETREGHSGQAASCHPRGPSTEARGL